MSRRAWWLVVGAVVTVLALGAQWPVTTRVGVNYQGSSRRIPLYEKTINFISRDLQTRRLAREITSGVSSPEDKLLKLFSWVTTHIHATPAPLPIVDDHPLHILIRGYGANDQRTEAFALLAGYSGFPSAVVKLRPPEARMNLLLALVQWGEKTLVFDVVNTALFRNERGELADVQELLTNPALIALAAPGLTVNGHPYEGYLMELRHHPRAFSRTSAQQLWPRIGQEVGRVLGIGRNVREN